jgi:hypothetical protein
MHMTERLSQVAYKAAVRIIPIEKKIASCNILYKTDGRIVLNAFWIISDAR